MRFDHLAFWGFVILLVAIAASKACVTTSPSAPGPTAQIDSGASPAPVAIDSPVTPVTPTVCPLGQIICEGTCVDRMFDDRHCGSCNNACAGGERCIGGACDCASPYESCSGACLNLEDDEWNCGLCGRHCDDDQVCSGGSCVCAAGSTEFGADCADGLDNDCDGDVDCDDAGCLAAPRECTDSCGGQSTQVCLLFGEWSECGPDCDACVPKEEICGDGIDQDCDGNDLRAPDPFEPNNLCGQCALATTTLDPQDFSLRANFDSVADHWDCYRFRVDDTSWTTSESIDVELSEIPDGHDYDLFLFEDYEDCAAWEPDSLSTNDGAEIEEVSFWEDWASDDTGDVYVIVKRNSGHVCDNGPLSTYLLTFDGLSAF